METFENLSIIINDLTKEYSKKRGIYNINTEFKSGALNLVVGENGSGKSTLIKCIMGLTKYQGNIVKRRLRIGYAPEEYIMPLNMTVIDFLYSIGRIKGYPKFELNENVKFYLNYFNINNYEHKYIKELSHGMRQKINLMQAFIYEPKILILDEPLASLDQQIIPKVVQLIKERSKRNLVVVSTHNLKYFNSKNKKIYHFMNGKLQVE